MVMSRKEYLDNSPPYVAGEISEHFRKYYGQFVNESVKQAVVDKFGIDRLLTSADFHFNDIPLADWDQIAGGNGSPSGGLLFNPHWAPLAKMKEAGDYFTLAGGVCIAKEAAQIVCDEHKAVQS